jgi:TctA family transporter
VSCPKEAIFEKPKASSQYLMPLYVRCHIDGKPISRMLVDGGTAISLMSYSVFKKLGKKDDELGKTNLTLNGVGATRWKPTLSSAWSSL